MAEIEKKTLKGEKPKINISPTMTHTNSSPYQPTSSNEDLIIFLLTKKEESIFQKLKDTIAVEDLQEGVRKSLIAKLYDLYESGNIQHKAIDSICETDEERDVMTGIMMNENTNGDYEKILAEVIKSFTMEKLTNRRKELMRQLGSVSTKEEGESIAVELNEINNQLGQLMIR